MFDLKPSYVTDSENKKIAVQLAVKTYEKIEEVLENYGLYHLMTDDEVGDSMELNEAKAYYKKLKKKK